MPIMQPNDIIDFWKSGTQTEQLEADGLLAVTQLGSNGRMIPEERALVDKAKEYGADYVFFRARGGRSRVAEALVFDENRLGQNHRSNDQFAELHRRMWSWGAVPLVYRRIPGRVDLFRCCHRPDFDTKKDHPTYEPIYRLDTLADITLRLESNPWWDLRRLSNGTLWDDSEIAREFLSEKAAHASLLNAVKQLDKKLVAESTMDRALTRRLIIITLLVAYLEDRGVFELEPGFFSAYKSGPDRFFNVMRDAEALIRLLADLERDRFNGNVFTIEDHEKALLREASGLTHFAKLIEATTESTGQLSLWRLYSFKDLPVELISHIYQHFVQDLRTCVYTPPFLARLMIEEALSESCMKRLDEEKQVVFDPACGSGVFLVEAFKRLVLHWRVENNWKRPTVEVLRTLALRVHGTDIDPRAIELACFSLCLAMCEELDPETILNTKQLFPKLRGETLHPQCFFEMKRRGELPKQIGVIVGNPPFKSAAEQGTTAQAYSEYVEQFGRNSLPDKQAAYLFLHHSLEALEPNGILCLLQKDNFLYNRGSTSFRRRILARWDVRELLDFTPVRSLFEKDAKAIVVVANAQEPDDHGLLLHAVFRRTVRTRAKHSFELDYYDMHWIPRKIAKEKDFIWRCNLFGGGRAIDLVERLKKLQTFKKYASKLGWEYGEGFVVGETGYLLEAEHLTDKQFLPAAGLHADGVDESSLGTITAKKFRSPYGPERFTPPLILIGQTDEVNISYWDKQYLPYDEGILGVALAEGDKLAHKPTFDRLARSHEFIRGWIMLTSTVAGIRLATAIQKSDFDGVPFPDREAQLDITANEQIILDDAINYYRNYQRFGDESEMMFKASDKDLDAYADVFVGQIKCIYEGIRRLPAKNWPGVCCMPFAFSEHAVEWSSGDDLAAKLEALLRQKQSASLTTIRLVRLFDGPFMFLIKPDRLRYWLRSVALRDADETLSDLRAMGY